MTAMRWQARRFYHDVVLNYDGDDCLAWPFATDKKGYAAMTVDGKARKVARLVCEEFRGPPPSPKHDAAHSCGKGDRACVSKHHLVWKTRAENMADKVEHGTMANGERNGKAKLTEDDVRAIRSMRGLESQGAIASKFGITSEAVRSIHIGRTWGWLQ